jgi:hypothetical protein
MVTARERLMLRWIEEHFYDEAGSLPFNALDLATRMRDRRPGAGTLDEQATAYAATLANMAAARLLKTAGSGDSYYLTGAGRLESLPTAVVLARLDALAIERRMFHLENASRRDPDDDGARIAAAAYQAALAQKP